MAYLFFVIVRGNKRIHGKRNLPALVHFVVCPIIYWHCFRGAIKKIVKNKLKLSIMKKIIGILAFLCLMGISYSVNAQVVKKTTHTVKKSVKAVGNKTAEVASKGKATVTDQVYKNKVGPAGQTIYIDNHSKYYWIDKKGHKNYITEAELKDKSGK